MISNTLKVVFFGSSNYCLPVLETLHDNFAVKAVITPTSTLPEQFTLSRNIKVFTPTGSDELLSLKKEISQLKPDLAIVADFGLIIPKEIFTLPRYQTLNIHFSHLPKLRGPSPIQYTILLGEESGWISLIIMDEKIDTGNIIWQKEVKLAGNETSDTLYKKLFNIAAKDLPAVISLFVQNKLHPITEQNHSQATYTKHLTREDGYILPQILDAAIKGTTVTNEELNRWPLAKLFSAQFLIHNSKFSILIERAIRAFSPWPGVWTMVKRPSITNTSDRLYLLSINSAVPITKRLKIIKVHLDGDKLVLDQVQLEGKNPVSWKQFKEGHPHWSFEN